MIKNLVMSGMLLMMAACGGSSGGVGGTNTGFSGNTSQAVVTASNAKALSSDAYQGVQNVSSVGVLGKTANDNQPSSPRVQELSNILESSIQAVVRQSHSTAKVVAATIAKTINGASGSYFYNIDFNQTTGAFTGSLTFSRYKQYSDSASISGSINCTGVYDQPNDIFTSFNITMNGLSGSWEGVTETLTGTISMGQTGSTKSITISAIMLDGSTNRTYWFKDLIFKFVETSLTISGTYYDPIHGYVVISTVTPLTSSAFANAATSGQLLFTGANGSKARLTFTSIGNKIEVDTVGNNTFVTPTPQ